MNPDSVATAKAALRQRLLAQRTAAAEAAAQTFSGTTNLWHTPLLARLDALAPRCVGFYWPMQSEPDLRETLACWLAADKTRSAALPVVVDKHGPLHFHRWSVHTDMHIGRYGIAVPAHIGHDTLCTPDLLLVPCLGFDQRAYRLGYGGGFYDRTLAAVVPRPRTLGIAWEATRLDSVPTETHDIPLDGILTESACF